MFSPWTEIAPDSNIVVDYISNSDYVFAALLIEGVF